MRQHTLGSALESLLERSSQRRVRVEFLESGDTNAPDWETTLFEYHLHVQELSVRDRIERDAEYSPRQTHTGFGEYEDELTPGARLIETHRLRESGAWEPVMADDAQKWQVLGVMYLSGTPDPQSQVELHLHRMAPKR
jgi:hypothetical protein